MIVHKVYGLVGNSKKLEFKGHTGNQAGHYRLHKKLKKNCTVFPKTQWEVRKEKTEEGREDLALHARDP